jgi:hypothetical protein
MQNVQSAAVETAMAGKAICIETLAPAAFVLLISSQTEE